jgi:ribosome-associated heat shock protein Hsp15
MREGETSETQRLDQWLWFARIIKSRTLAQDLIERGKVRLNRQKIDKSSTIVKKGDVLTLTLGAAIRTLEVVGIGKRRGPATEAQLLYVDRSPVASPRSRSPSDGALAGPQPAARPAGSGRPSKRDRRLIDKLKKSLGPL